ncbi:TetR/AcrR family transcriptional regulator, partial [Halomonas litopenaei]|nr:TetR/AcrR family transcriptional regulator [Halomonas litopenaei]
MEKNKDRDAKGRIIDLATDLFLQNGFAGTSMSAIAKASGMTKASLYYHFANKEDLFIACVTDGYQHALSSLETIVADDQASPEEKLSQAFDTLY